MNASHTEMTEGPVARLLEESRWLSGLARRLVQDPGLADDLAQDTMVAALEARSQPEPSHRRGWLATILRRKLISRQRQEARRTHREKDVARSEALPSAHEVGVLLESERLLRDALAELDEPYQRVVMLRYREGLSAAEIARRDGEHAGTVRSRLRTGLQQLRVRLETRDQNWGTALVPLAALSSGPGAVGGNVVGTASAALGGYMMAAALLLGVALPIGWMLSRGTDEEVVTPLVALAATPVEGPAEVEGGSNAPTERVQLSTPVPASLQASVGEGLKPEIVPGVIAVTVVDEQGQPIGGAIAQRWDNDHIDVYSQQASDANGLLEVSLPKQRAAHQLEEVAIRAPGWAAARLELTFRAGQRDTHREVALRPAVTIHGSVYDPLQLSPVFGVVFVSPLPDDLIERLESGASLRDVGEELKALEFLGVFEASDRDTGEFWLRDVEVGARGQVIAMQDDKGGRIGWSDVIELKAGEPIDLDPIVIRARKAPQAEPDTSVRVRMILPEGADPDEFEVSASYADRKTITSVQVNRSTRTEYVVLCGPQQSLTVTLRHSEGKYLSLHQRDVTLETGEVVFEVMEVEHVGIQVVDSERNLVDVFEAQVFEHRAWGSSVDEPRLAVAGLAGTCSFQPPIYPWRLRIVAAGGLAELGPFPAGEFPGPSTIELEAPMVYRGTLLRAGAPCSGAKLTLRAACDPGTAFQTGEILTRAKPGTDVASVVTGSDGTFEFQALLSQALILGVEIDGIAVAALELGEETELSLDVPGTGAVIGTVEAVYGELEGGLVTVSTELGMRRSASFGPDGAFRFDNLPAGQWILGETYWAYDGQWLGDAEQDDWGSSSAGPRYFWTTTARAVAQRPGSSLLVVGGDETPVTLRVQAEEALEISGRVLIDGQRPRKPKFRLRRAGEAATANPKAHRSVRVKRKGDFSVSHAGPGRWRLESMLDEFSSMMWAEFEATTGTDAPALDVNFLTGTLILNGVSDDHPFSILIEGPESSGLSQHAVIVPMGGGSSRRVMRGTLAGKVKIIRMGKGGKGASEVLVTGTLQPGETLELSVQ